MKVEDSSIADETDLCLHAAIWLLNIIPEAIIKFNFTSNNSP